jgi:hypothetical protein
VPVKTKKEALDFVKRHGAVLESAKGTIPNLAQAIAGEPIQGSWWGHPKGNQIHMLLNDVCDSPDVMRCRLHDGKITLVHRRLWPALVKMAHTFDGARLSTIREEHTSTGAHRVTTIKFPDWVSDDVHEFAKCISMAEAEEQLGSIMANRTARKSEARR